MPKRLLSTAIFLLLFTACTPEAETDFSETTNDDTPSVGSFNVRNTEIRDEMIQMISDAGIKYWISEEGAINYNLSDGEAIDRIGNEVISEYITRN